MDANSLVLEAAFVGKSKEAFDSTVLDIDLGEVVHVFGAFLKYEVLPVVDESASISTVSASTSTMSAFAVMIAVQKNMSRPRLPDRLEKNTMTRKEKLYNDVIGLLEKYTIFHGMEKMLQPLMVCD